MVAPAGPGQGLRLASVGQGERRPLHTWQWPASLSCPPASYQASAHALFLPKRLFYFAQLDPTSFPQEVATCLCCSLSSGISSWVRTSFFLGSYLCSSKMRAVCVCGGGDEGPWMFSDCSPAVGRNIQSWLGSRVSERQCRQLGGKVGPNRLC